MAGIPPRAEEKSATRRYGHPFCCSCFCLRQCGCLPPPTPPPLLRTFTFSSVKLKNFSRHLRARQKRGGVRPRRGVRISKHHLVPKDHMWAKPQNEKRHVREEKGSCLKRFDVAVCGAWYEGDAACAGRALHSRRPRGGERHALGLV
jgi:hypothetical protein